MKVDVICKICGKDNESLEHNFFGCRKAKLLWSISPARWDGLQQFEHSFPLWWRKLYSIRNQSHNHSRLELTACLLCNMWTCRNNWYFNNSMRSEMEIVENAQSEWLEYMLLQEEMKSKNGDSQSRRVACSSTGDLRMRLDTGSTIISISAISQQNTRRARNGLVAQNS